MLKLMDKKIFTLLAQNFCLSKPVKSEVHSVLIRSNTCFKLCHPNHERIQRGGGGGPDPLENHKRL